MHPSLRLCSTRAHQPLIRFLGKRSWPAISEAPHPHPAAPAELKQRFAQFVNRLDAAQSLQSSKHGSGGSPSVFKDFWEAPHRLWQPKVHIIEDNEIEAVMVCAASFITVSLFFNINIDWWCLII
ncbi:hypothetical protein AMATHDRAFT_144773 [Amanita thiersii Skay4041]|uniref:Uncharacterized protein n=1 Tax=Amanita thiersii Skay4041 TaxID=703135 RepID=A0A2A9NQF5_9AGAR|nr:hypothetical protein AMATHDRAFT_144773 [Amanita thiersii Skay4041]